MLGRRWRNPDSSWPTHYIQDSSMELCRVEHISRLKRLQESGLFEILVPNVSSFAVLSFCILTLARGGGRTQHSFGDSPALYPLRSKIKDEKAGGLDSVSCFMLGGRPSWSLAATRRSGHFGQKPLTGVQGWADNLSSRLAVCTPSRLKKTSGSHPQSTLGGCRFTRLYSFLGRETSGCVCTISG